MIRSGLEARGRKEFEQRLDELEEEDRRDAQCRTAGPEETPTGSGDNPVWQSGHAGRQTASSIAEQATVEILFAFAHL